MRSFTPNDRATSAFVRPSSSTNATASRWNSSAYLGGLPVPASSSQTWTSSCVECPANGGCSGFYERHGWHETGRSAWVSWLHHRNSRVHRLVSPNSNGRSNPSIRRHHWAAVLIPDKKGKLRTAITTAKDTGVKIMCFLFETQNDLFLNGKLPHDHTNSVWRRGNNLSEARKAP